MSAYGSEDLAAETGVSEATVRRWAAENAVQMIAGRYVFDDADRSAFLDDYGACECDDDDDDDDEEDDDDELVEDLEDELEDLEDAADEVAEEIEDLEDDDDDDCD